MLKENRIMIKVKNLDHSDALKQYAEGIFDHGIAACEGHLEDVIYQALQTNLRMSMQCGMGELDEGQVAQVEILLEQMFEKAWPIAVKTADEFGRQLSEQLYHN